MTTKVEDKNVIKLFTGTVRYYKGVWSTDNYGKSYVALDDSSKDSWEFSFRDAPASSENQLTKLVLPKMIQETLNLDYPAYVNWENGFVYLEETGQIPSTSKRFDNLISSIDVRGER